MKSWFYNSVFSRGEFYYVLFGFDFDRVKLIWVFFVDDTWAKFSVIKLAMCFFTCGICFLDRGDFWGCWCFYYFLYQVLNYFWIGIGVSFFFFFFFFLSEGSPGGSFICFDSTSSFCSLLLVFVYIFWWGFCFLRVTWYSHVFALLCEPWFVFWRYCGFGDNFIGYDNEGVGKMYYGFFLICIWFWD